MTVKRLPGMTVGTGPVMTVGTGPVMTVGRWLGTTVERRLAQCRLDHPRRAPFRGTFGAPEPATVMAGLVPATHDWRRQTSEIQWMRGKIVDGRHKPGHDGGEMVGRDGGEMVGHDGGR